ncbi:uncharacterized protein LOC127702282 [Mytilus californianus]|uniref:uncharacterized protein LOC127702282 n=1 Tax=Mytilus californianus TaxID=6549 RepID=UPI00224726E5|nr:uncharacterized protein LOC127702282 [Mytilus californianus]
MLSILTLIFIVSSTYAVQWPKGTYTLVKPKAGCPAGWKEGWRKQDNEDSRNANFITYGHHFFGSFGRNMVFHYCTKDEHAISGTQHWPRGNYCILRQGISCPPGFKMGSIHWDDEDSRNKNGFGGVLPSGIYGRNTLINYCCRSDESYRTEVILPRSKPFYLLRFKSPCQQVQGMVVREEIVKSDDEDKNNKNSVSGSHPLNDGGRNNRLYYCYYH